MNAVAAIPLTIAIVALAAAAYILARGLGWIVIGEHPSRLLGKHIRFRAVESDIPLSIPQGQVTGFESGAYVVELSSPIQVEGESCSIIRISARHRGSPVSSASRRRILAVNGDLPRQHGFIACVNLV